MKLADLPRRVIQPLGEWPEMDAKLRQLERNYRFRANNRALRAQQTRDYKAGKKQERQAA